MKPTLVIRHRSKGRWDSKSYDDNVWRGKMSFLFRAAVSSFLCGNRWEYKNCLSLSQSIIHHHRERWVFSKEGEADDDPLVLFPDTAEQRKTKQNKIGVVRVGGYIDPEYV